MHYDGTAFAIDDRLYTMLDLETYEPVERNEEISPQDFELLNKIYPGGDEIVEEANVEDSVDSHGDRNSSVLVLNSNWDRSWKPAILINSNGNNEELSCFERDSNTEARGCCSVNWHNQMVIFGGRSEKQQISRLDGFKLKRIGSLKFDHSYGACSIMNNEIYLCFDYWSGDR